MSFIQKTRKFYDFNLKLSILGNLLVNVIHLLEEYTYIVYTGKLGMYQTL